jgi:hypothetical protein
MTTETGPARFDTCTAALGMACTAKVETVRSGGLVPRRSGGEASVVRPDRVPVASASVVPASVACALVHASPRPSSSPPTIESPSGGASSSEAAGAA